MRSTRLYCAYHYANYFYNLTISKLSKHNKDRFLYDRRIGTVLRWLPTGVRLCQTCTLYLYNIKPSFYWSMVMIVYAYFTVPWIKLSVHWSDNIGFWKTYKRLYSDALVDYGLYVSEMRRQNPEIQFIKISRDETRLY